MKYTLNKDCYNNPSIIKLNTLAQRSYFIPYPSRKSFDGVSLLDKRYKSKKVICLNGEWDFKHYHNPKELAVNFDTDEIEFEKIDVPSCIEYRGYEKPEYINARYNFPYFPPFIPKNNPVSLYWSLNTGFKFANKGYFNHISLYRKYIEVKDLSKLHILSFLGVCSAYELYVNGNFVGYAEESHNTSEFDITKYLNEGYNEILVLVHRWSTGSYLECQDMFRNTGIFRDVLLRIEDKEDIFDIDLTTKKHENLYDLTVTLVSREEISASVSLDIPGVKTQKVSLTKGVNEIKFENLEVKEWNAEEPCLYDVEIESHEFYVKERIGFKDIKIIGDIYLLNDHYIKFKGVNHHDTSYINGYTMSPEEIKRDLEICKEYNIDTVRTSHYAPDPLLMELAQEMGIYIVSEVDLETHGVFFQALPPSMNRISSRRLFIPHYLSRVTSHYNRDKIHKTPIIMWSLGNESGGGVCIEDMYKYLKGKTDIPIHYEGVVHHKTKAYDIASQMYPQTSLVHKVGEHTVKEEKFNNRPYFMCEYAHAMGVGPGDIESYWDEIYSHVNLIGGCVWEMVDHGFKKDDKDVLYGGDNNEWIHDSNFCCDGIFYPDRTPSTGAYIVKHAYRPIRIKHLKNNKYSILNTCAFTNSSIYKINFIDSLGSHIIKTSLSPLTKEIFEFDTEDDMFNIEVIDTRNNNVVSLETIVLRNRIESSIIKTNAFPKWFKFDGDFPSIREDDFRVGTSKPFSSLFRAETDNDKHLFIIKWMRKWYKEKEIITSLKKYNGYTEVEYHLKAAGNLFKVTDRYQALEDGVLVTSNIHTIRGIGYIPRFIKTFKFDKSFTDIKYFGREKESYIDMKDHSIIGEYERKVTEMTEPNIKPQESGNRMDTRYVEVINRNAIVRFSAIDKPFELSVKPYSDLELAEMKHRSDETFNATYVGIGCFNMGIGTGSCGPETKNEYKYSMKKDYSYSFKIEVIRKC